MVLGNGGCGHGGSTTKYQEEQYVSSNRSLLLEAVPCIGLLQ